MAFPFTETEIQSVVERQDDGTFVIKWLEVPIKAPIKVTFSPHETPPIEQAPLKPIKFKSSLLSSKEYDTLSHMEDCGWVAMEPPHLANCTFGRDEVQDIIDALIDLYQEEIDTDERPETYGGKEVGYLLWALKLKENTQSVEEVTFLGSQVSIRSYSDGDIELELRYFREAGDARPE